MSESTSNTSRRARERATVRERIIQTALNLLEDGGMAAVTMRRVATDMEYTAPIVYQHFANKDALVIELVAHGYRLMSAELREVLIEPDVDQRMQLVAAAYVRFAGHHPHLYEAMNGTVVDADRRQAVAEPTFDILHDLLADWSTAHNVDLVDRVEACEVVWGTLYGMASLGYLDNLGNERAQHLAQQALSALLRGWRSERPQPSAS